MFNVNTQQQYTQSELKKMRTLPKNSPFLIKKNGDVVKYLNYEHMYEKLRQDKLDHPDFLDRELFEDHSEHETYCLKKFSKNNQKTQAEPEELEKLRQEKEEEIAKLRKQLEEYTQKLSEEKTEEVVDESFIEAQVAKRSKLKKTDD